MSKSVIFTTLFFISKHVFFFFSVHLRLGASVTPDPLLCETLEVIQKKSTGGFRSDPIHLAQGVMANPVAPIFVVVAAMIAVGLNPTANSVKNMRHRLYKRCVRACVACAHVNVYVCAKQSNLTTS